jgi:hypothetical protein
MAFRITRKLRLCLKGVEASMEARKSRRTWVWVVLITLLILLVVAVSAPVVYVSQARRHLFIGTGTFEVSIEPVGFRNEGQVFIGPNPGGGSGHFTCHSGHMPITIAEAEIRIMECSP